MPMISSFTELCCVYQYNSLSDNNVSQNSISTTSPCVSGTQTVAVCRNSDAAAFSGSIL